MNVAVAAPSSLAADAGGSVARFGGNAVDAAIAATLVAMVTEPGVCAFGGGGFVTVWGPSTDAVTIDGYMEMPGRGLPPERFGRGGRTVWLDYGGGLETIVGHGSVATPGGLEALAVASRRFGHSPWQELFAPVIEHVEHGFPLSPPCSLYLGVAFDRVFGWHPESSEALAPGGVLVEEGGLVHIAHLADSLRHIASHGAEEFYRGDIARAIAADMEANGGLLTRADLASYQAVERRPLMATMNGWTIATNPGPAIGGAALCAMVRLVAGRTGEAFDANTVEHVVNAQRAVFGFRREHLDHANDRMPAVQQLLELSAEGDWRRVLRTPSTVHISAVDDSGLGCSITMSAGYGSGVMTPSTGIWMNNSLGEIELNRQGYHALPPGTRLVSNMAPTVAHDRSGAVVAIGSPGADRITTAILSTLIRFLGHGADIKAAVEAPRLHVEYGEAVTVAHEPGLDMTRVDLSARAFDSNHMFFGGVGATVWDPATGFQAAADSRRAGGISVPGVT